MAATMIPMGAPGGAGGSAGAGGGEGRGGPREGGGRGGNGAGGGQSLTTIWHMHNARCKPQFVEYQSPSAFITMQSVPEVGWPGAQLV